MGTSPWRTTSCFKSRRPPGFKPFAHSTVFLVFLGAIVLALIGMLEYGLHVLPQISVNQIVRNVEAQVSTIESEASTLWHPNRPRDLGSQATATMPTPAVHSSPSLALPTPTMQSPSLSKAAASYNGPSITILTETSITSDASAYQAGRTSTVSQPGGAATFTLDAAPSSTASYYPSESPGQYQAGSSTIIAASISSWYEDGSLVTGVIPKPTRFSTGPGRVPSLNLITMTAGLYRTGTLLTIELPSPMTDGKESDSNPSITVITIPPGTYEGTVSTMTISIPTKTYPDATASATIASGTGPSDNIQSDIPLKWVGHVYNYVLGVYIPALLSVALRLLLDVLYKYTKLVSPFYMLASHNGTSLYDLFSTEHLGSDAILTPMIAFRRRNWMLLCACSIFGAAQLITLFSAELIWISLGEYHTGAEEGFEVIQAYALCINTFFVRVVQGLLAFIFIQLVNIWYLIRRRATPFPGSPASIAMIASFFGKKETGHDILRASQYSSAKDIATNFPNHRYRLMSYAGPTSNHCLGVVLVESQGAKQSSNDMPSIPATQPNQPYTSTSLPEASQDLLDDSCQSSVGRRKDALILTLTTIVTLTLFGVILAYTINRSPTSFETIMDSQTFGPRFVLSFLGIMVQMSLLPLCARTVTEIPFARLMKRSRSARLDIVAPIPLTALGSIRYSYSRQEWFAGSLAITTGIVMELLLILLPGVPFQSQQYWEAARLSFFGCLSCLGVIILVVAFGWGRLIWNPRAAAWPRSPTTIGAVASYVANTDMARDCAARIMSATSDDSRYRFARCNGRWRVDYA